MSFDWTKEELAQELKEREEDGETQDQVFNFVWSIIERAYEERDSAKLDRKNISKPIVTLFDRDSWHVMEESPFTSDDIKNRRFSKKDED